MNRAQKIAWFRLSILAMALGLSVVAFCVAHFILGLPARRAVGGFGFIGIMGLLGLIPILFRQDNGKVQWDERDLMIHRKATVAAAMIPWFMAGPNGVITVNYLPWMVFGGMFIVELVQAAATLRQYGWTNKETSHE